MNKMFWVSTALIGVVFFQGCATPTAPAYNESTRTAQKSYTTGELGSHFVRDLFGIGGN